MKVTELTCTSQTFLNELREQMEPTVQQLFDAVLVRLGKPSHDDQRRLDKLGALENGGVDNWDNYDWALEDWFENDEGEEE
jgi:hypothetical protein